MDVDDDGLERRQVGGEICLGNELAVDVFLALELGGDHFHGGKFVGDDEHVGDGGFQGGGKNEAKCGKVLELEHVRSIRRVQVADKQKSGGGASVTYTSSQPDAEQLRLDRKLGQS